jgi:hypothetical protein
VQCEVFRISYNMIFMQCKIQCNTSNTRLIPGQIVAGCGRCLGPALLELVHLAWYLLDFEPEATLVLSNSPVSLNLGRQFEGIFR